MSAHTNGDDPLYIEVRLFGGPIVLVQGEAISLSRYQSYLVALVFGHAQEGISRSRLIDFLWDEPDGAPQRHRLSQLLLGVKKKCGRQIMRDDGGFLLNDLADRSCDLTRVLQSVRHQDFHEFGELRVTDFLSRIENAPTVAFESWRESLARRSEDLFTEALLRACADAEAEARWADLGALLSVAAKACPPTEDFLQRSIRHLVMVDDADQVPETVSEFAARWERANGKSWLPGPTTSELCHEAKECGHSGRTADVAVSGTPLIGRRAELKFLHTRLTAPKTKPQLIVVMGEAGIGKTRIIEEAMRRIRLDGMRTLAAGGAEFEDCIPLNPIIDVLQQLSEEDLSVLGEPWVTVLRGLMPRAHGAPEKTMAPPLRPLSVSRRLMEAFLLLFEHLSGRQPLALFLDDVHWMDETTLAVIQFVRRRAKGDLTIVLVLTTELIQKRTCVQEFLASINGQYEHLAIEELAPAAAEEIVDHLTKGCLPSRTLESICALGAGNAFYLTELAAEASAGRMDFTAEPNEPAIPPSVQNLLQPRLSKLSNEARGLLAVLAVSGQTQALGEAAKMLDKAPAILVEANEELLHSRLMVEDEAGCRIGHPLVRRAVYDSLSPARRRMLHERVAQSLCADDEANWGALAMHLDRAGRATEALKYSLLAAGFAEQSGAFPEAIIHLSIARRNEADGEFASEILSLLLGACASSGSMRAGEGGLEFPPMTRTGVQPGDQVTIAFYTAAGTRLAEVSGERDVDPSGELFLPFLGTVSVVGLETAEIRRLLEERYGALYSNPVVEVVTRINVNITGAVRSPGQFYLPPSATLVDALARAGGVTSDIDLGLQGGASDPSQVRLVRDGVATVIDLRPLDIRPEVMALQVQSGDWLFVPRARGSQTRERITFWGSLLSTLLTAASLIVLIAQ